MNDRNVNTNSIQPKQQSTVTSDSKDKKDEQREINEALMKDIRIRVFYFLGS